MGFCPNCGTKLEEGAHFCSNCGQGRQNEVSAVKQTRASGGRRLHCPNCHSTSLSPVVETEITGGTSLNHSFSRRNSVSSMQFNNTHRNYWMCSECGNKFRNLQNLEEEIAKLQKAVTSAIAGLILIAVLILLNMIVVGFNSLVLIMIIPTVILALAVPYVKNKIRELEKEKIYLKRNCFG